MRLALVCVAALSAMVAVAQEGPRGGGMRMGMFGPGRNVMGAVSEAAPDHIVVNSYLGATYTIHLSEKTRFLKQPPMGAPGEGRREAGNWQASELKATDIKPGLDVEVQGELNDAQKTVEATAIVVMDAPRAAAMRERMQSWGKSWLMGKVTAIDEAKLTVQGSIDNLPHVIVADENTQLRKRREPITLADVAVGDQVMVEGAAKAGSFAATSINVMGPMLQGGPRRPSDGQPRQ